MVYTRKDLGLIIKNYCKFKINSKLELKVILNYILYKNSFYLKVSLNSNNKYFNFS